jgi:hypothetical protein
MNHLPKVAWRGTLKPLPRDGALALSGLRQPTLSIVCDSVATLMEQHGDAKLTDLLQRARPAAAVNRLARESRRMALASRLRRAFRASTTAGL